MPFISLWLNGITDLENFDVGYYYELAIVYIIIC